MESIRDILVLNIFFQGVTKMRRNKMQTKGVHIQARLFHFTVKVVFNIGILVKLPSIIP